MAIVYLYKYNNYYNRKYSKAYDNLSDYGTYIYSENVNFNPADGINTTLTLGRAVNAYNGTADYLIYSENGTDIYSTWFIIEQTRNRNGQYILTLRRDVLADYPQWKESDTFIEKCTLNKYSPFIFNQEDMSFNEIKQSQTPIYDETGCPWIIGFYDSKLTMGEQTIYREREYDYAISQTHTDWLTDMATKKFWDYNEYYYAFDQKIPVTVHNGLNALTGKTRYTNFPNTNSNLQNTTINTYVNSSLFNKTIMDNYFKSSYSSTYEFDDYSKYEGKIIKFSDGYFQTGSVKQTATTQEDLNQIKGTTLWNYMNSKVGNTSLSFVSGTECNNYAIWVEAHSYTAQLEMTETIGTSSAIKFGITDSAVQPQEMPYKAFCMPFGNVLMTGKVDGVTKYQIPADPSLNLQIASYLNSFTSTDTNAFQLIDCQIVPYCPLPDQYVGTNPGGEIDCFNEKVAFPIKDGNNNCVGFMYALERVSNQVQIMLDEPIEYGDALLNLDNKVANQVEKYRLCAGNYTSAFDFNIVKNGGLKGYNISFTYKPFDSYIRVQPIFGNLYGGNFKDSRGLICSGISLAKVNDTFNQYRLNNKYYQQIFDRQIDNLEFNNKYQLLQQGISAGVGALGTGVTAGLITGNADIGVGTGALSAAGGVADIGITKALQNEALDYTKDNFGYQLQTIKAQPNTLARTADYNADTQYVPFLEYYTCTEEEKVAFTKKLQYNGMTAMFIDKPIYYIDNTYYFTYGDELSDKGYFKGVPIRLEDLSDDYHLAKAIAEELNKGVYMK